MLLNPQLLNVIIEKVHEGNMPITIDVGELKDELVEALFEFPESYEDNFNDLLNDTINEIYGLSE